MRSKENRIRYPQKVSDRHAQRGGHLRRATLALPPAFKTKWLGGGFGIGFLCVARRRGNAALSPPGHAPLVPAIRGGAQGPRGGGIRTPEERDRAPLMLANPASAVIRPEDSC